MAAWAKNKIFWKSLLNNTGAILSATNTESSGDFSVAYLADSLEWSKWKSSGTTVPIYITNDGGGNYGADIVVNGGFETAGGGGADVWGTWVEAAGDGAIANETTDPYAGTNSAKLTEGVSDNTSIKQNFSGLTALDIYELNFYTAGDNTNDGSYRVYDVTNAAWIFARAATGITALPSTGYTLVERLFQLPASCTEIDVYFYPKEATSGAIAYFDAVTLRKDTQADSFDYLAIGNHNLNTVGASVQMQYSYDNFVTDINSVETAVAPSSDDNYLVEFASAITANARYTRLVITGTLSAAPSMAIAQWGDKTVLDYATSTFDPDNFVDKANINIGKTGMVLGIHRQYKEKKVNLKIDDSDGTMYTEVYDLVLNHGLKNFFWAYDTTNEPSKVYTMRLEPKFDNPFNNTGIYRNITLPMIGRVA